MNYKRLRSKLGDLVLLTKISASYLPSRDPIDGFNMGDAEASIWVVEGEDYKISFLNFTLQQLQE
jgi:hypothetical protein